MMMSNFPTRVATLTTKTHRSNGIDKNDQVSRPTPNMDTNYQVGRILSTKTHHARWHIDRNYELFDSTSKHQLHVKRTKYSDTFKIGNWEWQLCLCKSDSNSPLLIGIDPIIDGYDKEVPPIVFLSVDVSSSNGLHKTTRQQEGGAGGEGGGIIKRFLKDNVMWRVDDSFTGKFTVRISLVFGHIEIEKRNKKVSDKQGLLASLGRMLSENIYTDVTINTIDGVKINAHRAVLASRSLVFRSMFSHDLQEKEHSTINITDMSTKACQAFFKYIYGNMEQEELVEHRLELLGAADKYDIPELRETCVESFCQDIDRKNVVEMLLTADFYQLPKLKSRCMQFLVKSGNIFEIQDEFKVLLQSGDRDLVSEIFHEILKEWKSCRERTDID